MSENLDLPGLPGYASIKESAKILGVAERTVYEYVEEGRLPGFRAANVTGQDHNEAPSFAKPRTAQGAPTPAFVGRMSPTLYSKSAGAGRAVTKRT